jgi:hypothetical protein
MLHHEGSWNLEQKEAYEEDTGSQTKHRRGKTQLLRHV